MVLLLRQPDGLFLVPHLHPQPVGPRRDREVPVPQPAHQVERLLQRLLLREPQRVRLHAPLHRRPHLRRAAEEAVRRHQAREPLVRPLEVVPVDEEPEPPRAVREVGEHRPRQELLPQRLPEPLDLPQGLRVLRPALQVSDPLPPQLLLERRRPAPGRVLPPLVGQDLPRRPVGRHGPVERLQHQRRPLMVRQRVPHHEPRVVVQERRQVQPLVPPQQEREQVRLPQLVRQGPLEAPLRLLPRRHRLPLLEQPLLVQDPPHLALRHPQRLEPPQHVPDPPRPVLRVLPPQLRHRLPLRRRPRPGRLRRRRRQQRLQSSAPPAPQPLRQRRVRYPEHPRHVPQCRPTLGDLLHRPQLQLDRVRPALHAQPSPLTASSRPVSPAHPVFPSGPPCQPERVGWC